MENKNYQKEQIKKKISDLRKQRATIFVDSERQIIDDHIRELREQLAKINAPEKKVVPVVNAPIVKDRRKSPKSSLRSGRAFL